jgi:hypothetical protein
MKRASFTKLEHGYCAVRFTYDPDAVDVVKRLPSFSRQWDPQAKMWKVDASFIHDVTQGLQQLGYTIIGLEGVARPGASQSGNWAEVLFNRVGPDRADAVFRSLTRILHPDNPATGDGILQQELNKARDRYR